MELAQPLIRVALSSPWEAYLLAAFPFSDQQARETCQVRTSFAQKSSWGELQWIVQWIRNRFSRLQNFTWVYFYISLMSTHNCASDNLRFQHSVYHLQHKWQKKKSYLLLSITVYFYDVTGLYVTLEFNF